MNAEKKQPQRPMPDAAREAVARTLKQIMEERHPGTRWVAYPAESQGAQRKLDKEGS